MLELYISETCPYCQKVMRHFDEKKFIYEKYDVSIPENLETVLNKGGKAQVPFLIDRDNNQVMYESDDIINYANRINNKE